MNPVKGEVSFPVDDKTYILQFTIDAICSLEAENGKGIIGLISELQDPSKVSLTLARQMLWAGLQEHHPEITVKEAGELIPAAGGMMSVMRMFEKAFKAAFPELKEGDARPRKAGGLKNGTGPHSTASGAATIGTTKRSGERHLAKSS